MHNINHINKCTICTKKNYGLCIECERQYCINCLTSMVIDYNCGCHNKYHLKVCIYCRPAKLGNSPFRCVLRSQYPSFDWQIICKHYLMF